MEHVAQQRSSTTAAWSGRRCRATASPSMAISAPIASSAAPLTVAAVTTLLGRAAPIFLSPFIIILFSLRSSARPLALTAMMFLAPSMTLVILFILAPPFIILASSFLALFFILATLLLLEASHAFHLLLPSPLFFSSLSPGRGLHWRLPLWRIRWRPHFIRSADRYHELLIQTPLLNAGERVWTTGLGVWMKWNCHGSRRSFGSEMVKPVRVSSRGCRM